MVMEIGRVTSDLAKLSSDYQNLLAERDQLIANAAKQDQGFSIGMEQAEATRRALEIELSAERETKNALATKMGRVTSDLAKLSSDYQNLLAERDQLIANAAKQDQGFSIGMEQAEATRRALEIELSAERETKNALTTEIGRVTSDLAKLSSDYQNLLAERDQLIARKIELEQHASIFGSIEDLRSKLELYETEHELIAAGLYPLSLEPEIPDDLKAQLEAKRSELAAMVRHKTAAICTTKWTINGSTAEGTKATKHYIRIMLRTFNADADSCLDTVRWNNLDKCLTRLTSSFEYVNELGATHATTIQSAYLELRLEQIRLMHRYKEALYQRKEAMRAARIAAAEEKRAQRELERARAEAEQEELRYQRALDKARAELISLGGTEHAQMLIRITELEQQLASARELKARATSMAQITKAGFVYVVSNIGSFGLDVLKIGMTRRIDPLDRIRELGGASVPFPFDVHAMIYSEDAPRLENLFHRNFSRQRINLANGRKEFFRVSLPDVIRYAKTLSLQAEFTSEIEAKDFKLSEELHRSVLQTLSDDELQQRLEAMVPQVSDYDDEGDETP